MRGWVVARSTTAGSSRKTHKSLKTTSVLPGAAGYLLAKVSEPVPPESSMPPEEATGLALAGVPPSALTTTPLPTPDSIPQEADPKKQYWWRPADSKTRAQVAKIVVLRAAGHKDAAIAKKLKTTDHTIRHAMYVGRKNGWLDADDEVVDVEAELAFNIDRKIVRNLSASLDGQMTNWQTHEMTIAAAKGRGHFKNHEVSKNDGPAQLGVVAIQVIMPALGAQDQLPELPDDQVGGVPSYLEAEVRDGEESTSRPEMDAQPAMAQGPEDPLSPD